MSSISNEEFLGRLIEIYDHFLALEKSQFWDDELAIASQAVRETLRYALEVENLKSIVRHLPIEEQAKFWKSIKRLTTDL